MKLIRIQQVAEKLGVSVSWIYKHLAKRDFPRPIKLTDGGRAIAWRESDIDAWIETRIEESKTA